MAISGYFSHGSFQVSLQTMGRRYSVIPFFFSAANFTALLEVGGDG